MTQYRVLASEGWQRYIYTQKNHKKIYRKKKRINMADSCHYSPHPDTFLPSYTPGGTCASKYLIV
jgi:hypothetical protein